MDVNLDRYYNSEANGDQDAFGYNWSLGTGADSYLIIPADNANAVDYFDGSGDSEMFYIDPTSGQWIAPPGSDISMSMNASSTYDASQFTLFFRHSGITEKFTAPANSANKYADRTSITDRNNNTISYTYNSSGQLTSISDSYGNPTTINWGSNGYIHTIVDPAGRTYTYQQNSSGQLTSYTDPDGNITHYYYGASSSELDEIVTGAGNVMTIGYYSPSTVGHISQVQTVERYVHPTDSSGPDRTYTYGTPNSACSDLPAGGVQTTETDENGNTITYCTDDLARIRDVIDGNGNERSLLYTNPQFPASGNDDVADPGGYPSSFSSNQDKTSTTLTYSTQSGGNYSDGRDNVTQITQNASSGSPTTTFGYNPDNDNEPSTDYSPTKETDAQGHQTS